MVNGWLTSKIDGEFVRTCHTCVDPESRREREFQKRREKARERLRIKEEKRLKEIAEFEAKYTPMLEEMDKHLKRPLAVRCSEHDAKPSGYSYQRSIGKLDPLDVVAAYHKQNGKCLYCQWNLDYVFNIEHKRPKSRGGCNDGDNIAVCCGGCNKEKGTRTPEEWTPMLRKRRKKVVLRRSDSKEVRTEAHKRIKN